MRIRSTRLCLILVLLAWATGCSQQPGTPGASPSPALSGSPAASPGTASPEASPRTASPEASPAASPEASPAAPQPSSTPTSGNTEDNVRALLERFLEPEADYQAMTDTFKPTDDDYAMVFDEETMVKAKAFYAKKWAENAILIKPKSSQTELSLYSATTEDLRDQTRKGRKFPRRWRDSAQHLKPGLTWYMFKFTKPLRPLGMRFEGLTYVNGHWVFFPKPWNAIR